MVQIKNFLGETFTFLGPSRKWRGLCCVHSSHVLPVTFHFAGQDGPITVVLMTGKCFLFTGYIINITIKY